MIKNMGAVDRFLRTVLALVAIALYFSGQVSGAVGIILLVIAVIFLLTSVISFCPLYVPLKLSTRKK